MPESPRWLMAEGRFEEALAILKKGADTNNNTLPPDEEIIEMMRKIKEQVRFISQEFFVQLKKLCYRRKLR